jgi:hypothetical protein
VTSETGITAIQPKNAGGRFLAVYLLEPKESKPRFAGQAGSLPVSFLDA